MNGYILFAHGTYLTKYLYWYPHDVPELAYVFNPEETEAIIANSKDWAIKPEYKIPARYEVGLVVEVGKPIKL